MSRRSVTQSHPQVAIVGGGIAGSVAAIHLAHAGIKALVLEKSTGPHHKVCGEFLSDEGVRELRSVGVDFSKLGARPIRSFRLHGPTRTCEATLPSSALGVSRFALDEELLSLAAAAGAEVQRGVVVRELLEGLEGQRGGIVLDTSRGEVLADRMILATGKSDLRSVQEREGRDSSLVGFKMHLRLKPSVARQVKEHCDLFVFDGGYGGLSPIENGLFNFCFLIDRARLSEIGTSWDQLAHHITKHCLRASIYLDGAQPQFRQFVTVANVPYGFVRRERAEPGIFVVGDQMAVIASLAGDGMSMAAMTAYAAAATMCDPCAPGRLQPAIASRDYEKLVQHRLRWQVEASYAVHLLFKRPQACDWATYAVRAFPQIVELLFAQTRCRELPASGAKLEQLRAAQK